MSNANGMNHDSGNVEWYTPLWIIDRVRRLYDGIIDLDPASCEIANQRVKALHYFSKEDCGEDSDWYGNVWVNHPYGRDENEKWSNAIIENYNYRKLPSGGRDYIYATAITGICYASTSEKWCNQIIANADAVSFISPRIAFYDPSIDEERSGSQKGSMIYYFGPHAEMFAKFFNGHLAQSGRKRYTGSVMIQQKPEEPIEVDFGFNRVSLFQEYTHHEND